VIHDIDLKEIFQPLSNFIDSQLNNKGNIPSKIKFDALFKNFSNKMLTIREKSSSLLSKFKGDITSTYQEYCWLINIEQKCQRNRDNFIEFLSHQVNAMAMIDKWINNLYEDFNSIFIDLNPEKNMTNDACIFRIYMNLKKISLPEEITLKPVEDNFISAFSEQIQSVKESCLEIMSSSFNLLPPAYPQSKLIEFFEIQYDTPNFTFSQILEKLEYFTPLRPSFDIIVNQIQKLHKELLASIKNSYQKDPLMCNSGANSEALKKQIIEIIYKKMINIFRYLMVSQDILILKKGANRKDITGLLPSLVLNLLIFEGFDEIFSPSIAQNIEIESTPPEEEFCNNNSSSNFMAEDAYISNSKSLTPPIKNIKNQIKLIPKKSIEMPNKNDFIIEKKRSAIIRMLEIMGFEYIRSGKGSHEIYQNPSTGNITVVPHSVDKLGTRRSIFEQASESKLSSQDKE